MVKGIIENTHNFIKNNNLFGFLVTAISPKWTCILKRREYNLVNGWVGLRMLLKSAVLK